MTPQKLSFSHIANLLYLKKKGGSSDDDGIVSLFIQVRNCHSVWNKDNTFCGVRKQHDELQQGVAEDICYWLKICIPTKFCASI